jgi:hypothetical protein
VAGAVEDEDSLMNPTPTLALEQLMLDPRYPELVDRIRALTPPAVRDQADAASSETLSIARGLAPLIGDGEVRAGYPVDFPGWLRLLILDAFAQWLTGKADTCRHNPHPSRPQPIVAAAWRPGLVACRLCTHLVHLPRGSDADATCDLCGHQCAGVPDDPIYPSVVQLGPLMFMYGTCSACRPDHSALPVLPRQRARPRGARGRGRGGR